MKKIGIIGYGIVGKAYHYLFPEALVYDINGQFQTKEEINQNCDISLVCVPTPMKDGGKCDISAVESSVDWLKVPLIVIKSTIPVGTTERLKKLTGKKIIFNPEFLRAKNAINDLISEKNIIIGGAEAEASGLVRAYQQAYPHQLNFYFTTSSQAEMI